MLENFTRNQLRAIKALSECFTVELAARATGVTERTLYRWLEDPVFKSAVQQEQGAAIAETSRRLVAAGNIAVDALLDIVQNPTQDGAATRRLAASSILDHLIKLRDFSDLDNRITALEEAYSSWLRIKRE